MNPHTVRVEVHREADGYWAHVTDLPGCHATGTTLDELISSLTEGISLYLEPSDAADDHRAPANRPANHAGNEDVEELDEPGCEEDLHSSPGYLTRVTELVLAIEPDVRPGDPDRISSQGGNARKRQSHREDWPPRRLPRNTGKTD